MKVLFAALCLLVSSVPVRAQGVDPSQYDPQTWFKQACPTCGIDAYVDVPAQSATVSRASLLSHNSAFLGWGFEHNTGGLIDRVEIFVETGDNVWTPIPQTTGGLILGFYRPDVYAAFGKFYSATPGNSGWAFLVSDWPDWALGAHRVTLVVWRGPYHVNLVKTLNIVE